MRRVDDPNCIHIGLVNNMPDSALEATERQFRALLDAAAEGITVQLSLYGLPGVPRSGEAALRTHNYYSDIHSLWNTRLDGIIVTGTEPLAPRLRDEPFWESLRILIEWAERNTYSAIWSCLAAHAALLQMDGIERRPLCGKLFGVFESARVSENSLVAGLMAGVPDRLWIPHSRWNGLPDDGLESCGYHILSRSKDAGVDVFVKQRNSLFVFFQGHPEYEADSLLLEYRRDIRRFLKRENDVYPSLPQDYFEPEAAALLIAFQQRAMCGRREELLTEFPAERLPKMTNPWRPAAVSVYRNWIRYIYETKAAGETRGQGKPHLSENGGQFADAVI